MAVRAPSHAVQGTRRIHKTVGHHQRGVDVIDRLLRNGTHKLALDVLRPGQLDRQFLEQRHVQGILRRALVVIAERAFQRCQASLHAQQA